MSGIADRAGGSMVERSSVSGTAPDRAADVLPWPRTIVFKLTLFVALLVLVTAGALGWLRYGAAESIILEQVQKWLTTVAAAHQALLTTHLRDYETVVALITDDMELREVCAGLQTGRIGHDVFEARCRKILANELDDSPGILAILIVDRSGKVLASTDPAFRGRDLSKNHDFASALGGRRVGEPFARGRKFQVFAAGPVPSKGDPMGVAMVLFDWTVLARISAAPDRLGASGEVLLGARRGQALDYLLPSRDGSIARAIPLDREPATARALRGESGVMRTRDYRGVDVLAAFRPVEPVGWGLVVKMDTEEAYEPLFRLRSSFIVTSLLMLVVGVTGAYVLARRFARPILELAVGAQRIALGELETAVPVTTDDEVGRLGHCFHRMARSLAQSHSDLEKKVEARTLELEEARTLLESIVQGMGAGVLVVDVHGRVLLLNPRAASLLRLEPGASLDAGWTARHGIHRDAAGTPWPDHEFPLLKALRGEPVDALEMCVKHDEASEGAWVSMTARPLAARSGEPWGVVAVLHDVTDLKRAESWLRESQERLRLASRMKAVGTLAAGVAHHFNNMLQIILAHCESLAETFVPEDPRLRSTSTIQATGERASELVKQLLRFGPKKLARPAVVDLSSIVGETLKVLRSALPETVRLESHLAPGTTLVQADPRQIEELLMNLVLNARDAMPAGGTLSVMVGPAEEPAVGGRSPIAEVCLEVSDTGQGLDPAVRDRIFEPFFTTKSPDRGTGLGLSIVYAIVRDLGGSIEVRSERDQGARFRVALPRASGEPGEVASSVEPPVRPLDESRLDGGETILVVEDENAVREMVVENLRRRGYTVLEAIHAQEGLAVAEAWDEAIDLLLSDVVLPGMDGVELAARLRSRQPRMRVLFMTAHGDEATGRVQGGEPSAPCVLKPFRVQALLASVRAQLDAPTGQPSTEPGDA